jgi:hypothetical protein
MTATWALTDEEPDHASTSAEPPIQACMKRANRNLKLAEADGTCPPGFKSVEWGVQGPPGEQGEQGIAGPEGAEGLAGPQGDAGPAGPKGDTGDTGPVGAPGAAGSGGGPDEYVSWTFAHKESNPRDASGNYQRVGSQAALLGPADATFVRLDFHDVDRAWIRENCDYAYVSIGLARSSIIGWEWSSGERPVGQEDRAPQEVENAGGYVIAAGQEPTFAGYMECYALSEDETQSVGISVPDMDISAVVAVDYLEPDSIRQIS